MDEPFNISRWQPTQPLRPGNFPIDRHGLEALSRTLVDQTADLLRYPYHPVGWLKRAETLRSLRYPELALGDAHKAALLCRQHLQKPQPGADGGEWRLGYKMGFWMIEPQPQQEVSDRASLLHQFQEQARELMDKTLVAPKADGKGKFHPRPYPWLPEHQARRSDSLVESMNAEFAANVAALSSPSPSHQQATLPFCHLRRHAFGPSSSSNDTSDTLGVFASRDIPANALILVDSTRITGCCGPGSGGDTANLGGALACGDPVHPNFEDEDAGMELRWVRDLTGTGASAALLTCRLLLEGVKEGKGPLEAAMVARLTPNYRYPEDTAEEELEPESFYLVSDIEVPVRALQQFGVDVFADHAFDTWVVFTVSQRQYNNVCGDAISGSLMPLFSLFNHSCEPNVEWSRWREDAAAVPTSSSSPEPACTSLNVQVSDPADDDSSASAHEDKDDAPGNIDHTHVSIRTLRPIVAGEQLFVEYDSFERDNSVWTRRRRLRKWLSGDCMCTRCVREAALDLKRRAEFEERMDREQEMGRAACVDGGGAREWDDGVRGVLPEDGV